jgi:membrane protein DedA with SNARE-associated domain
MGDMFDSLVKWAEVYGYPVVFFGVLLENLGVPLPGETVVIIAGFLASSAGGHQFHLHWIIPLVFFAALIGSNVGYWFGLRFARPRLMSARRFLFLTPERLKLAEGYFNRYGIWTVVLCRFVTGVRVVAALAAGVAAMPWPKFFLGSALGAALWAPLITLLGFFFGKSWKLVHHYLGLDAWIAIAGILVALAGYYAWAALKRRRNRADKLADGTLQGQRES